MISFCCLRNSQLLFKIFPNKAICNNKYAFFSPLFIAAFNLNLISEIGSYLIHLKISVLLSIFELVLLTSSLLENIPKIS